MSIEQHHDSALGLTRVVVVGTSTAAEVIDAIRGFYAGETTRDVLWDLREATLDAMPSEDVRKIGATVLGFGSEREGGRTAIVASSDLAFGLSRMYEAVTTVNEGTRPTQVFRDIEKALLWLEESA